MALAVHPGASLRELSLTENRAVLLGFRMNNKCSRGGGRLPRCPLDTVTSGSIVQDERNQILTAYLWIRQTWYDAYLKWDRDQYDGLDSIRIPSDMVWRPDIALYNK